MRGTGKKKIEMKKIEKESSRMVTFSKRRRGLVKKAVELEEKTGARVALVVFSPRNNAYTYGDIPAMSEIIGMMMTSSSSNANNSIVPYHAPPQPTETASFTASSGLDPGPGSDPNFENLMRWVDSIDVDECRSFEDTEKLKQALEFILAMNHE